MLNRINFGLLQVRDFARSVAGNAAQIRDAQREFIAAVLKNSAFKKKIVALYLNAALYEHMKEAFLPASSKDELLG